MESLSSGQPCPLYCGGKLYSIHPGILINIKGQNLAYVNKYWIEKLRCALCNEIFSANIPAHVHQEKYHPSFKAMLALQKYYMAMPFHRQEYFQSLIGFPIPSSTQWQLMEELAGCALLVFPALEKLAAPDDLAPIKSLTRRPEGLLRCRSQLATRQVFPGQTVFGITKIHWHHIPTTSLRRASDW